jgi:hypothetical protein
MMAQVWSLDVDPEEQQLVVGGVSPQLHLYKILGEQSEELGASDRAATKEARPFPEAVQTLSSS